ncbi:putative early nodulin-like protein 2-like [Capsicum annuum]|nr:putative early nodulin-like protein 2-like [Capsicum annuum]
MRFKRVAEVFDEVAKARFCISSGSEHSSIESITDLYDLVNSFIENGNCEEEINVINDNYEEKLEENGGLINVNCFDNDLEIMDKLRKLLLGYEESDVDYVKKNIKNVVENALGDIDDLSIAMDFKRRLMSRLRDRGFDVGICKSKWERNGHVPCGNYEYIDVNMIENRYIIEINLAREFEIAWPTTCYTSLLEIFPSIYVGKVDELKQVLRIMSRAMRKSMKKMDIHVPPWRQIGYMQTKWFDSYKRTINNKELFEEDDFF